MNTHTFPQTQTKDAMRAFFDQVAQDGRDMMSFPPHELTKVLEFERQWAIAPGQRILEPGCGSGRLTALLAQVVGPQGQVVACDLSPQMLSRARDRQLPPNVQLIESCVLDLDFPPATFDQIICFCVFPHFIDPAATLRRLAELLRPGGHLWINHLEGSQSLNAFHRGVGRAVGQDLLPSAPQMQSLLQQAGFTLTALEDTDDHYILHAVK